MEGFKHFAVEGVAAKDCLFDKWLAKSVEDLAECVVVSGHLGFECDGVEGEGERRFAFASLGEVIADLLLDHCDLRVELVGPEEGFKGLVVFTNTAE